MLKIKLCQLYLLLILVVSCSPEEQLLPECDPEEEVEEFEKKYYFSEHVNNKGQLYRTEFILYSEDSIMIQNFTTGSASIGLYNDSENWLMYWDLQQVKRLGRDFEGVKNTGGGIGLASKKPDIGTGYILPTDTYTEMDSTDYKTNFVIKSQIGKKRIYLTLDYITNKYTLYASGIDDYYLTIEKPFTSNLDANSFWDYYLALNTNSYDPTYKFYIPQIEYCNNEVDDIFRVYEIPVEILNTPPEKIDFCDN